MYMGDFQKLIDFENLYNSCQVSLKGKGKKQSAIRFNVLVLENLCVMKRQYLQYCLAQIKSFLSKLYLTLNDKTEIVPMSKGIRFLGFHSYLTEDRKVIRKLTGDNKRQIKKRLRKNAYLVKEGKMSREKFDEKYNSWKNHASHGNCYKLICSMDEFVESLFTNKENTNQ